MSKKTQRPKLRSRTALGHTEAYFRKIKNLIKDSSFLEHTFVQGMKNAGVDLMVLGMPLSEAPDAQFVELPKPHRPTHAELWDCWKKFGDPKEIET